MFQGIRLRLVGWSVLVLGVILVVVSVAIYLTLSQMLLAQVDRNLQAQTETVESGIHELSELNSHLGREGYRAGLFYLAVGPNGALLANPQDVNLSSVPPPLMVSVEPHFATMTLDGEPVRLYVRPLTGWKGEPITLIVGQSLTPVVAALHNLLDILFISVLAGVALSLVGGWFIAGRALNPIQRAFARQQEFVADASHELRTPLTVLRAATDLLNQHRTEAIETNGELFDDVRHEIMRLERLAGDLLTMARSDLGELNLAVGELDLGVLASDVVRRMTPLASAAGLSLQCRRATDPLLVEGDPDRLQQVLVILLDNALKHTPTGGTIEVAAHRHGADAVLQVIDSGEGIAPEHLAGVFRRFYRADRARSQTQGSAGLGLSIARTLVEAHGGQLALASTLGTGTTVTIHLRSIDHRLSLMGRIGKAIADWRLQMSE